LLSYSAYIQTEIGEFKFKLSPRNIFHFGEFNQSRRHSLGELFHSF